MSRELLVAALVFAAVLAIGSAVLALVRRRASSISARLHADASPPSHTSGHEADTAVTRVAGALGKTVSAGRVSSRLRTQLARAGYHGESAAAMFLGYKFMLLFLGIIAAMVLVMKADLSGFAKAYVIGGAGILLFFVPNFVLHYRRKHRATQTRNNLPYIVDLLEICVSAGLGLDMAWNSVSEEMQTVNRTVADEMALVNLEVQLGKPRSEAMRNMADRTGGEELNSLVALIVQSERFGTGIASALRSAAESMREHRTMRAEETAEKTAVKLLFPLVFFIFPAMLIVMVGPAGITLVKILGGG
jgi:tight adherence protein C